MKTAIAIAAIITASSCSHAIGNFKDVKPTGRIETISHTFQGRAINELDLSAGVDAVYTVDQTAKSTTVTIKTDEAMMPYVRVELDGDGLCIYRQGANNYMGIKVNATVTGPMLKSWDVSSGSNLSVFGDLSALGDVEIDASSGSEAQFYGLCCGKLSVDASSGAAVSVDKLTADKVEADASSGASIKLAGTASVTNFDSDSGGSVNASKLKTAR